jgi:hypothetical protein
MVAYEFYLNDSEGNKNLIGILPERRKVPKRITQKSILRWGRMLLYDTADRRSFYFERVTINEYTGKLFRFGPSLKTGIKIKVHCKK